MKAITIITVFIYFTLLDVVQSTAQSSHSSSNATQCNTVNNRRHCKFNSNNLKLDVNGTIDLVVKEGGRVVQCKNRPINRGDWYGDCDGDADDANFVYRLDKNGNKKLYGSIKVGNDICRIAPSINGDDEIVCTPKSQFIDEDIAVNSSTKKFPQVRRDLKFGFTVAPKSSLRGNNHHNGARQLYDDSGANIDVMVVWTMEAECRNAGLSKGCTLTAATEDKMRGLIDLAVAETNTAFTLSGINSVLRLVHAYRDPDYFEAATFGSMLDQLTFANDGYLESVHTKRALYGADVVHMIVASASSCGISWSGEPKAQIMFSLSQFSCATGYYSFGHEIAHNFNMQHDRATENVCAMNTTFNYGYIQPNAEFRTIMSYDCKMGQCDNMPKDGCNRVQRFSNSNPAYTFNGKPIGDNSRDNARQFNSKRSLVASFYPAMNCKINAECNDGDASTVDTCNTATSVCVFTPKPATLAPNAAPIAQAPTTAPSQLFFMESIKITGVNSTIWKTVPLAKLYISPIPVCTVKYDLGITLLPAVVRIQNVGPNSFNIRLQNPSDVAIANRDVHCVVVEEGKWKMPDGRLMEAKKYSSTVTDNTKTWIGQTQTYQNKYTNPVVLGQVMSFNDPKWSVFWSRASVSQNNAPTAISIITGKHVGEDTKTTRLVETVGYIVMEAGHATSGTVEVETGRGLDAFTAYTGTKYSAPFTKAFAVRPVVAVVCQMAMDDVDGSWAVLTTDPATTVVGVSIDEDQILDSERAHTTEEIAYALFSIAGPVQLTKI
jgi:hypothetical protein